MQDVASVWFTEAFWDLLSDLDLVFLNETRHLELPSRAGWKVLGQQRENNSGGVLILLRESLHIKFRSEFPGEDFAWIGIEIDASTVWWFGGAYIPGPSDLRFRRLQGDGHMTQFQSLSNQLQAKTGQVWYFGGDMSCIWDVAGTMGSR